MDGNGQQETNIQHNSAPAGSAHQKIIQPSVSFIEELKATPVAPTSKQPAQHNSPSIRQSPEPPTSVSSIYPQPTNGIGASTATHALPSAPSASEPTAVAKNPSKVLAVRAVAGTIIILNAINLYDWFLEQRAGYANWISILEIGAVLALAVGIFKLSESARSLFVMLSAVSLVLSCIGLIAFYASTHHSGSLQANHQPLTKAQLENSLQAAEKNTALPPQARQENIQQLQREISNLSGSPTDLKVKQYASTGILIVTAVGPLIFFTRPSIKQVFS